MKFRVRDAMLTALLAATACRNTPSTPPVLPVDMHWVTAPHDPLQWRKQGFLELTTAVRPPTSANTTAHIVVVMKVPDDSQLHLRTAATAPSFQLPVGAQLARIEYVGIAHAPDAPADATWRVLDVRQFEWRSDGMDCTVLRPDGDGRLVGLRWPCSVANDARAGGLLATFVREHRFAAPRSSAGRDRAAQHVAQINGCIACHQPNRPEDRRASALVQRGTDAAGLFSLRSVFRNEDPIERYRPVDTNLGDPWMTATCPDSEYDPITTNCRNGLRPLLRLDVAKGMQATAPHVLALCATRQRLAALLPPAEWLPLQPQLDECAH
ncbi:MAG: hypothetical protein KBG15_19885 [Kofleriaceae bacterium]|nr:hypothetical protein [Kofleriaceae bacterium]